MSERGTAVMPSSGAHDPLVTCKGGNDGERTQKLRDQFARLIDSKNRHLNSIERLAEARKKLRLAWDEEHAAGNELREQLTRLVNMVGAPDASDGEPSE